MLKPDERIVIFQTLYKTATPQTSVHDAEYYQPMVVTSNVNGKWLYFVRETHGWFDDRQKKAVNVTTTLSPEEGFSSDAEAMRLFGQQKQHRISSGFVHQFTIDPFKGMEYIYLGK